MSKQPAFPGVRDTMNKNRVRREKLLAEMEVVVPWTRLLTLIKPHYPKAGPKGGRPPMPLKTMLRVYFPPVVVWLERDSDDGTPVEFR